MNDYYHLNYLLLQPQDFSGNTAVVTKPYQLKHLKDVLKADVNQLIRIGRLGGAATAMLGTAHVASLDDTQATLCDVVLDTPPPLKLPVTLVVALPRPKVLRRLIADIATLGVPEIYIINAYRVEKSYWQSPHIAKLESYAQLGLEQAGDAVAPVIHLKKRFKPFVEDELPSIIAGKQALVAHPSAVVGLDAISRTDETETVIIFGAEGGFIDYEIDLLCTQGCRVVSLGRRILRTETAVSYVLGCFASI